MKNRIIYLFTCFSLFVNSQIQHINSFALDINIPKVKSTKMGPYIGYQRGAYDMFEFGGEIQFKKIKLSHPPTHAFRFGTCYDFKENVLGFDAAYWYKEARLGLTYGGIISHRTDFTYSKIGFAPALGFRLLQFHLQTGYTFFSKELNFKNHNTFFVALKFTLINKRDIDIKK